jgi:glyoxylate reductase
VIIMPRPIVFVTRQLPTAVMAAIDERFHLNGTPDTDPPSRKDLLAGIRTAEAMISTLTEQMDAEIFAAASRLKVIANYAVGYNNIDLDAARARGIIVTNTPDVLTETTADLTWALLLAVARRVVEGHALVQQGRWTGWKLTELLGTDVHGKVLGIVGMGRIGQAVARRAGGFNMNVLYCSRNAVPCSSSSWRQASLQEVLKESDFVSLHLPLTRETDHLIGAAELRLMRSSAFLINTSRGRVVDEAALVQALREGRLAGAALDVYEREPEIHPGLRELKQVVTLPHLGSATLATRVKMGLMCIENITAVLEGRPAPNRVA